MSLQQERETQVQVVRQTLLRIAGHKGVVGYMVLNPKDGSIVECVGFNNDRKLTESYADKLFGFVHLAQSTVRTLSNEDDLTFLRMRWRLREILIAPDLNKEFMLIVVQDQTAEGELIKGQDVFADK
jgi:dynein light chain roadblock-type